MSRDMTIIEVYESILRSLNLEVDNNGLVSMAIDDRTLPCTVVEKRLAVPRPERLRSGDWDGLVAFHPLSESISGGESPVLKKLRALVNYRISDVTSTLMIELMRIASDSAYHEKLTQAQGRMVDAVKNADRKTLNGLVKVLKAQEVSGPHNRVSTTYLKHGGRLDGDKYSRVCVVDFPITEEFEEDGITIFDRQLSRKRDKKTIEALFDYIVPNASVINEYSTGSNSMVAPYFHALMSSYAKVAHRLNKVTKLFKKHLENPDRLMIDMRWEEALDDLSAYRDLIPDLDGNVGAGPLEADTDGKDITEATSKVSSGASAATPGVSLDQPKEAPSGPSRTPGVSLGAPSSAAPAQREPDTGKKKVSFREVMEAQRPQQQPAPMGYPQQQGGFGSPSQHGANRGWNPQPYNQRPAYGAPMPYNAPPARGGFGNRGGGVI